MHRDLKELLDQTARNGKYILNSSWGRPFAIKNTLKRVGEGTYVPHGLRAAAAVRLIEAG